jgi:hypothetical protein
MQAYKFEVTPTVQKDGQVSSWQLCHMNPSQPPIPKCGDGSPSSPYPNTDVPEGQHDPLFQFKIVGNSDITFAPNPPAPKAGGPIWIHKKGDPNGPGVHGQIEDIKGAKTKVLVFKDENDYQITLKYQLNFVDAQGKAVTALDPEIINGGKGFWSISNSTALMIGGVVALVLLGLWFSRVRAFGRN